MSDLPAGWEEKKIGDIFEFTYGKSLPDRVRSGKGFPVYGSNGIVGYHDVSLTNGETIIIGRKGSVGEVNYSSTPCFPIDTTYYIDQFDDMSPKFWFYLLKSSNLGRLNKATAIPGLNRNDAYDVDILFPPLHEQKRIADKLDQVLARVDSCQSHLERVPQILKRFRQSVLAAATSGRLTEEWREEKGIEYNWQKVKFTDIGTLGRGKSKHRPRGDKRLYGGDYPFIQTGDIAQSNGWITSHSQTYSEFGLKQSKLWDANTVCITIAANIANTAILSYPACFPDSVVGFVADPEKSLPQFVKWSIDVIKNDLESFAPATAQKNINLSILEEVEFDCPSLEEQAEIVRRVETLFAYAAKLEARYQSASEQVERLTPSLLAKAFRGELVGQDPNDEPASALVRRIREARDAQKADPSVKSKKSKRS